MLGLLVIVFFVAYLIITVIVIKKAIATAKANNMNPWGLGLLAAFLMYNLVFWDWIPTVLAHKYYCATQAGFFVYKTPEQWKFENPDLTAEDLTLLGTANREGSLKNFEYKSLKSDPNKKVTMINSRIYEDSSYERDILSALPIHKHTFFFADVKDDKKLAAEVTFASGYRDPMGVGGLMGFKYWIAKNTCSNSTYQPSLEKVNFINEIFGLEK